MTPAVKLAKKAKIAHTTHEYQHDSNAGSYGLEAAEKMAVAAERIFKTLVVDVGDKKLVVAVVPVTAMLNLKAIAKAAKAKKAIMADKNDVMRSTGYVLGGVSPLGQKKRLLTVIDSSAQAHETIYVSAGRRGLEIELSPLDLKQLTNAEFAAISSE
ncbi:Cys-tRNA(Pro) deacylase [Moritella sp.]|uniref:Cys-tRNA(Pro) deacylase n=1 Tax=Moritella sp. TaxID=78556 RepID=UPI001D8BE067|nr:Cys-tRNA(Pro) deacylase [Moritella sp.]MCJ8349159.1 Cys-tRNA(Pro) deacylase [Moritella sp.]NQZ39447.1 Cys-tRNA(Pro) deacylase [Moritella sp.]